MVLKKLGRRDSVNCREQWGVIEVKTMSKEVKVVCLILCFSVLVISGCATLNKGLAKAKVKSYVPDWMREPLTYKLCTIEAIGMASPSIIPEVAMARAETDLYNRIARAIDLHVTSRVKDMVEDHAVFEDPGLSHSYILHERISDQVTKKHLKRPFLSEIWTDRDGIFGAPGMVYAYGWVERARVLPAALRSMADVLKERKVRLKLSEEAAKDLDKMIEGMYKKAEELEEQAKEEEESGKLPEELKVR